MAGRKVATAALAAAALSSVAALTQEALMQELGLSSPSDLDAHHELVLIKPEGLVWAPAVTEVNLTTDANTYHDGQEITVTLTVSNTDVLGTWCICSEASALAPGQGCRGVPWDALVGQCGN